MPLWSVPTKTHAEVNFFSVTSASSVGRGLVGGGVDGSEGGIEPCFPGLDYHAIHAKAVSLSLPPTCPSTSRVPTETEMLVTSPWILQSSLFKHYHV